MRAAGLLRLVYMELNDEEGAESMMTIAFTKKAAACACLLATICCGGSAPTEPLDPPERDGGPAPCECRYESGTSCHVSDAPSDPACLRAAGDRAKIEVLATAECFATCGENAMAELYRCIAPLVSLRYECFARRSERVIECMRGDETRYRACAGDAGVEFPCDDTEEEARACREGN